MGVDAVMDKDLYESSSKKSGDYVTSINPAGDSDSDDERPVTRGARYVIASNTAIAVTCASFPVTLMFVLSPSNFPIQPLVGTAQCNAGG